MAFTQTELVQLSSKVLAAGVVSSEDNKQYYEASLPNINVVDDKSVWSQMSELQDLPANNIAEAAQNAFNNPHLIRAYGYNADGTFDDSTALRLTPVLGSNQHDWVLFNTYNTPSSGRVRNVISPTQIPRSNGLPSAAYQMRLFRGLPSAGNEILTTTGFDGINVGFFVSAANGMVMFSNADKPANSTDPIYAVFYQYVGATGGGSFSGNSILLESQDGSWRIREDYPLLRFERKEYDDSGTAIWNTYQTVGHSVSSDGLTLHRPYDIKVNRTTPLNDDPVDPEYHSVFRVSGVDEEYIFGNSQDQTVIETARGTEIERADAVRDEVELENRPLNDLEVILDTTDTPVPNSVTEMSWVSNINYDNDTDFIRFNELGFEVLEAPVDNFGDPVPSAAIRVAVETPTGELIQETTSKTGLDAGIDAGFNLREGFHLYPITPRYTDKRTATTVTRIQLAKGYRIKLSAGEYNYNDPLDNGAVKTQIVPRQKAKVEFLNHVHILDGSNFKEEIYQGSNILIDNGINVMNKEFSDDVYPLVAPADHTNAFNTVAGNYEDTTFLASGEGGVKVLFEDGTTRTQFWTQGDKDRLVAGSAPQFWKEVTELEIEVSGIFTAELDERNWDVVNTERFIPLIRYEGTEPTGYRVEVLSTIVDYKFQESQDKYSFLDRKIRDGYSILPTIDVSEPEYVKLRLPRSKYTINRETPRKIKYYFMDPVKVYGYFKDPVDPQDPTTGTFVPSIKADVVRVYEESIISGSDLSDRVDSLEGTAEWDEATRLNLPTLHVVPSLQVLADEDGEWLLWSDLESLYTNQDEHQWLFQTGQEAYFELDNTQGTWGALDGVAKSKFTFNPMVVHVPEDTVGGFEVSFGWHESFNGETALKYGEVTLYVISHGRGSDVKITINIPVNASLNWRFRQRRDGSYSYMATPHNDNLASVSVPVGQNLEGEAPVDNDPPILID